MVKKKTAAGGKKTKAKAAKPKTKKTAAVAPAPMGAPAATPALPVFYKDPHPLNAERHAKKSLRKKATFSFAATTNSVPLNAGEFPLAMRHYPIVFTATDPVMAVAVLGLRESENLFVSADGQWQRGCYVPAYVRRYPFIFLAGPEGRQFALCLDEGSDLIVDGGEQPFFDAGKPSDVTNRALKFCTVYQGQSELTREFATALDQRGLLIANRADATLKSGEKIALAGFRIVDEKKFNELPDDVFLEWRAKGWLMLIYSHLFSMRDWAELVSGSAERS